MSKHKSIGFFPITLAIIALALIWIVGHGEAGEASLSAQQMLFVDTIDLRDTADYISAPPGIARPKTIAHYTKLMADIAFKVYNGYMDPIDPEQLTKQAIEGMLQNLDPFSVILEKKSYEDLMEKTQGKYEGLGIVIAKRGDYITVISPFEGTPAYNMGIRAGDKIIAINGTDSKDMTTEAASDLMRGKAGTKIKITIQRPGMDEPLDYEVERAVIELKSVNYAGITDGNIGYVRLSKFSETATDELRQAIDSLMKTTDLNGLILDLRSNGGGLLSQAVEVSNLFLKSGDAVVSTRGHDSASQRIYTCLREPLYKSKPLAILVDGGTASASEIVSGAIQDWDRGIIIGNTTFGKGLVQQIFTTSDPDIALKLTTAKYYIPSGRCIQRPEISKKQPDTQAETDINLEIGDTTETRDKSELFLTKGGRPVYGGGGIIPDIEIPRETWQPIEINLERQNMFFEFAVDYATKHPQVDRNFETTDEVFEQFKDFCHEHDFNYKSILQSKLEEFEKVVKEQKKDDLFRNEIDSLHKLVDVEKTKDFERSQDWIRKSIKREIIRNRFGETGVYEEMVLKTDPYVQKALDILRENKAYSKLLKPKDKSDS